MTSSGNDNQKDQAISTLELAVWGELLSTLGDVVSTIAAVQALEEEQKEQQEQQQEQISNNNMQKQIDYLTNEVKQLKKQMNNVNPRRS
ncbi:hypothetical protein [Bacillus sp. FSL K6-3431]|uniref:hypothetical protein n=1 Tax=Bacillus sp. FSL K6-3431 TaxID=2921500 RepID=UPI0030F58626